MKRLISLTLVICALLICVSVALVGCAGTDTDMVEKTHNIDAAFTSIDVDTDISNVYFAASEDGKCRVVSNESEKIYKTVSVENGRLVIRENNKKLVKIFGLGALFNEYSVTVYLPEAQYSSLSVDSDTGKVEICGALAFENVDISSDTGSIKLYGTSCSKVSVEADTGSVSVSSVTVGSLSLECDTGSVSVSSVTAGALHLECDTGSLTVSDTTAESLDAEVSTGRVRLERTAVSGNANVDSSTGSVELDAFDAANIYIESDTGSIRGTVLTGKSFDARSTTGKVSVPASSGSGVCRIRTDTGSINITLK